MSMNEHVDMATLREALEHIHYQAFRAPIYTVIDGESRELSLAKLSTALDELAAARERIAAMEDVLREMIAAFVDDTDDSALAVAARALLNTPEHSGD